jgi:integrase
MMARPRNSIPSLCLHRPTGQWYVRFRGEKPVYLGTDRAKADRKRLALAADRLGNPTRPRADGSGLSLAEALALYRAHVAARPGADARAINRLAAASEAALQANELLPARQFRARALRAVRDRLLERDPPLSRRYVNHLTGALKAAFAWLAAEELVPVETLHSLRTLRSLTAGEGGRERPPVPPVAPEVVEATLPHLAGDVAAMVSVQLLLGCRPGEVCRMRRGELSTRPDEPVPVAGAGRTVAALVAGGALVWLYCPARHKNLHRGKPRVIPVGPEAQKILAPLLAGLAPGAYVFRPAVAMIGDRGAGCVSPGERYTERGYRQAVVRAVERHNRQARDKGEALRAEKLLPLWTPLQLRHAAAEVAANATDADGAAAMLGHAASRRALDTYVQATILKAAEVAAKVG